MAFLFSLKVIQGAIAVVGVEIEGVSPPYQTTNSNMTPP